MINAQVSDHKLEIDPELVIPVDQALKAEPYTRTVGHVTSRHQQSLLPYSALPPGTQAVKMKLEPGFTHRRKDTLEHAA